MSANLQRIQERSLEQAFNQINQTFLQWFTNPNQNIEYIHRQNFQSASTQNGKFRPLRPEIRSTAKMETTVSEPPLPFYKHLTSISINEDLPSNQQVLMGQ